MVSLAVGLRASESAALESAFVLLVVAAAHGDVMATAYQKGGGGLFIMMSKYKISFVRDMSL